MWYFALFCMQLHKKLSNNEALRLLYVPSCAKYLHKAGFHLNFWVWEPWAVASARSNRFTIDINNLNYDFSVILNITYFCFIQEVDQPKISITKPVSVKQEPKASSSLPSGNNNGKPIAAEKVKKEAEKRSADKVNSVVS